MIMPIRALETIRHNGVIYQTGDIVRGLSNSEKERLLLLKSAEKVETVTEVETFVQEINVEPELFKELSEALDENYNADDLKRAAKDAGVKFDSKDKKDEVIEAVISQGKVELLLEDGE